jgi:outer membrane protein TolC
MLEDRIQAKGAARSLALPRTTWLLFPLVLAGLGAAQEPTGPDLPPIEDQGLGPFDGPVLALTLEDALNIAERTNLGLRIQAENAEVRRFEHLSSWGAFDPVLTLSASLTDATIQNQGFLSGSGQEESVDSDSAGYDASLLYPFITGGQLEVGYSRLDVDTTSAFALFPESTIDTFTATFTQPLLRGAWEARATTDQRESELRAEIEAEKQRQTTQEVLGGVADGYWDLVSARQQLGVSQLALQLGRQQLADNRRRLEVGVGTEVEVLQAEANVATREEELLRAQVDVVAASDSLRAMILPRDRQEAWPDYLARWKGLIEPLTPLPDVPKFEGREDWPDWSAEVYGALELRSELIQGRLEVETAEVQLERARSNRLAALDLLLQARSEGFGESSSDALDHVTDFDFPVYSATLTYSLPLRNRTARFAEEAARAGVRIARLSYEQTELTIVSEVRAAVRNVIYTATAVAAAEASTDLQRRQLEAEQAAFREGDSTVFEVLDFQRQLSEALSSLATARAGYAKALVALDRAVGRIGEAVP